MMDERLVAFKRLLDIMDELREKCPWDMKQTMDSLRHLTIEETYELSDAILDNDLPEIKKELGDLMLHLAFYAKIGSEKEAFTMSDVLNGICEKLISRHPHIYGDVVVTDAEEVKANHLVGPLRRLAACPQADQQTRDDRTIRLDLDAVLVVT